MNCHISRIPRNKRMLYKINIEISLVTKSRTNVCMSLIDQPERRSKSSPLERQFFFPIVTAFNVKDV